MHRNLTRQLPAALLATGVLLATAAVALGAGSPSSITYFLHGGSNQTTTQCGELHHYATYTIGTKLQTDGYVTPAPSAPDNTWQVKIKVKQCRLGQWVVIAQPHVLGNGTLVNGVKEGHFSYNRLLSVPGFYKISAYYYGVTPYLHSDQQHYHAYAYTILPFASPHALSKWKAGSTVPVKMTLAGVNGVTRISDGEAASLAAACRVHLSATGAQTRSAVCMKYNSVSHQFFYNWKLGTPTGSEKITATVSYPQIATKTVKSEQITITS